MEQHPVLYILMRSDMKSLNPGKAMAQACHAANQFVHEHANINSVKKWQKEANGFGTTIVLDAHNTDEIINAVEKCLGENMMAAVTIDPEYPITDGEITHLIPNVITCGYVFSPRGRCELLSHLPLHK